MFGSRVRRHLLRLIPAALAVFELRVFLASAVHAVSSGPGGSLHSLSAGTCALLLVAVAAVFWMLRQSSRGLLAALAAGVLIAGAGLLAHLQQVQLGSGVDALAQLLPAAFAAATVLALGVYGVKVLMREIGSAQPPSQAQRRRPPHRFKSADEAVPRAPTISGWSGRGPPVSSAFSAA